MKRIRFIALILSLLLLAALGGCSKSSADSAKLDPNGDGVTTAIIDVKDFGSMSFELYPDMAPITVENFVELAQSGFYDGLIFHRIVTNFVVQGGDPDGTGLGGSDKTIKGEFTANGVKTNTLSHSKGVISMARTSASMDSATSQFFICSADCSASLDGLYAGFGKLTDGESVLDALNAVGSASGAPSQVVTINSIVIE